MQLFLLRPIAGHPAWTPWYDKAFGFVVRAASEEDARQLLQTEYRGGVFEETPGDEGREVWLDPASATCEQLTYEGDACVILRDMRRA